jgi:hypothetical protein
MIWRITTTGGEQRKYVPWTRENLKKQRDVEEGGWRMTGEDGESWENFLKFHQIHQL